MKLNFPNFYFPQNFYKFIKPKHKKKYVSLIVNNKLFVENYEESFKLKKVWQPTNDDYELELFLENFKKLYTEEEEILEFLFKNKFCYQKVTNMIIVNHIEYANFIEEKNLRKIDYYKFSLQQINRYSFRKTSRNNVNK